MREDIGLVVAPFGGLLIAAQYWALFVAATTTHTDSAVCRPEHFAGAGRGWDAGACLTEEQVWCRYHGNHRHVGCALADCRAEEVRLTLWSRPQVADRPPSGSAVYAGCSDADVSRIYEHINAMNGHRDYIPWANGGQCGVCVPSSFAR